MESLEVQKYYSKPGFLPKQEQLLSVWHNDDCIVTIFHKIEGRVALKVNYGFDVVFKGLRTFTRSSTGSAYAVVLIDYVLPGRKFAFFELLDGYRVETQTSNCGNLVRDLVRFSITSALGHIGSLSQ